MKRIISALVIAMMLSLLPVVAVAVGTPVSLFLNGNKVMDEPVPIIIDSYAFIELHTFARELEIEVDWDATAKRATLKRHDTTLVFHVGEALAQVNDRAVRLVALPFMSGEYVYLPMQFVGAHLDIKMNWDELTQSLMLYQRNKTFSNSDETEELGGVEQNPLLPDEEQVGEDQYLSMLSGFQMKEQELAFQWDAPIKPRSFYVTEPDRFVIDIPDATIALKLIDTSIEGGEINTAHPAIKKIRYAMHDPTTVRIVFDLERHVTIDVTTNDNSLILKWASYSVVIDPGHGGRDPGAEGASGAYEKHFTLSLSQKVMDLLEETDIQGYMTRTDDSAVSLEDRVKFANDLNADLFISIHGNTYKGIATGTETFYWQQNSKQFADTIHQHVVAATEFRDRLVKRHPYRVLNDEPDNGEPIKVPAVLLELGYLSTASEEKIMLTDQFQDKVAAAIVAGIKQYLGL